MPVGVGGREAASCVGGTQAQGTLDACFSTVSSDLAGISQGPNSIRSQEGKGAGKPSQRSQQTEAHGWHI